MNFTFDNIAMGEKDVDWDQFLVDAVLQPDDTNSPPSSDSQAATPQSTESEQSQALDPEDDDHEDFFKVAPVISHDPTDLFGLPAYTATVPDQVGVNDPTMTSTFGLDFGDFGDMTGLGTDAAAQLGLDDLLSKFTLPQPQPVTGVDVSAALTESYSALGWLPQTAPAPAAVEPALLVRPSLKRKDSDSSADSAPAKRPRGRPPKSRSDSGSVASPPVAKRPYRRHSKPTPSGTPLIQSSVLGDGDDSDDDESIPKLTASGKLSTARPKSVVPEKYFKDGSAQAITGMTVEQITAFPTFEELLKKVAPHLQAGAAEFGEKIKENRDKAKDAAKKSRDERRQKIDSLESTVAVLEGKIQGMQGVMLALVAKGLLTRGEVAAWL